MTGVKEEIKTEACHLPVDGSSNSDLTRTVHDTTDGAYHDTVNGEIPTRGRHLYATQPAGDKGATGEKGATVDVTIHCTTRSQTGTNRCHTWATTRHTTMPIASGSKVATAAHRTLPVSL